jgi:hypothetical protein
MTPPQPPSPSFLTEIAYILDRSGSMQPMQEPAVAAFNDFIRSQLDVPGDARLTLVLFDEQYEVPVASQPIEQVEQLTAATFVPRGSTALLDAIGRTVRELDDRIKALAEAHRPGKVIVVIFTDGQENASRQFTAAHISDLIRLYRDQRGWEFLFLAANQDAIASAARMNIDHAMGGNVNFDAKGIKASGNAMSRKIRAMRMKGSGTMDAQAATDDVMPMDAIIREEDAKPE